MSVNTRAIQAYCKVAEEVGLDGLNRIRYLLFMITLWPTHYELLTRGGFAKMQALNFKEGTEYKYSVEIPTEVLKLIDLKGD